MFFCFFLGVLHLLLSYILHHQYEVQRLSMSLIDTLLLLWSYTHLSPTELQQGQALATSPQPRQWKSLALTELLYRNHDGLSKFFALASFLPLFIVIFLAGLASAPCPQRRLPALTVLLFLALSVCLNVACKACVRSPRPAHPAAGMNYTTTHGMPSDHSQFMAGFVVYLARRSGCSVSQPPKGKRRADGSSGKPQQTPSMPLLLTVFCVAATLFVGAGRVYNGYHTVGQVLVGWTAGVVLGLVCTTPTVQRVLTWVARTVMLPVMLVCTHWTNGVC